MFLPLDKIPYTVSPMPSATLSLQASIEMPFRPVQMTTETALGVTKRVVQDKIPLDKIPYIASYMVKHNQPILPPGMQELLYIHTYIR
ncbi:hypothetical protein D9758_011943 [Tetrapyrgos nigripes]|uniref:Uncharacterized protein n=1 Tax=Tetrapyrgos nigripes TaxID=182062 RepID=A0A8H5FXF5_9AGAR|nr:hypothetical protein D9758_011943 [Tetrapyrgos nigripes]